MEESIVTDLAESMLAVLVIDLEYDHTPTHGHAPLRHQIAWMNVERVLGAREIERIVEKLRADVESGRNGAVKTNPLKE